MLDNLWNLAPTKKNLFRRHHSRHFDCKQVIFRHVTSQIYKLELAQILVL
jgi:hypothetical protein